MLINELQVKGRPGCVYTVYSACWQFLAQFCRRHNKLILSAWHNPLRSLCVFVLALVLSLCLSRCLCLAVSLLMFVSCKLFQPNKKLDQMQRHSSQQQQQRQRRGEGGGRVRTTKVNGEERNATVTGTGAGAGAATPGGYSFLHSADVQRTQTKWHMHMHMLALIQIQKNTPHTHTHAHGSPFVFPLLFFISSNTLTNFFLPSKTVKKLKCCLTTLPLDKFAQTHSKRGEIQIQRYTYTRIQRAMLFTYSYRTVCTHNAHLFMALCLPKHLDIFRAKVSS